MDGKSKKEKVRSEKDDKKTNAETSNDDLCCNENSADKKEEEVKTTSVEIWKDKKLRIVIFIVGVLHVFQICGITYLLQQNFTVLHQSYPTVPLETDPGDSSLVCGREEADVSERIINVVHDLNLLHNEFHSYVKDRQQETEAWVNELSKCNKNLERMIKNITDLEEDKNTMFQTINVLQKDYTNKTEEEKQHLKQLEANFTEKMLTMKQEILQNKSSKKLRGLYADIDMKIDEQKGEFGEHHNEISVDIERIIAKITKLDRNLNEYSRTLMKKEETIDRQFSEVIQSINESHKRLKEIDEKARKVKEEVDAEKKKIESTLTDIKNIEENMNHLNINNTEKDEHTKDKFSYIDQKLKESKIMMKKLKKRIKRINIKVHTEKRNVESTAAYAKELDDRIKELYNHTTEREKEVKEKFNSIEGRLNLLVAFVIGVDEKFEKEVKKILDKVNAEKEKLESTLAGLHGQLDYFSVELNDDNLFIVGFLVLVVMAVIFIVYKLLILRPSPVPVYKPTTATSAPQPRVGGNFKFSSKIVESTSTSISSTNISSTSISSTNISSTSISRQTVELSINLISFNSTSQKFYKDLIDAIPMPGSTKVHTCNINQFDEVKQTMPTKIAFVFVDFNERNIILEDPETEKGDLRRMTTQGLLKMGCDVFVIYVRDKGSRNLGRDGLYNPSLFSVEKHAVLHKLKEKRRVLSLYDRFHPQQVKFLEECLKHS
ncbi:uncharacterized protein LOC134256711 [Saccostrea cucullata]|uniref:uncharacterized protein LOC134256711 n=1 Tax=Saccostrea cuccullata TaxID=36930 RepID=UPI002ED22BF0